MATAGSMEESRGTGVGAALRTRVELWLIVVFMALAFSAGFLVGAMSDPTPASPATGQVPTVPEFPAAPPLSDEQLQEGLPTGHPDVPATDGAGGTDASQ